MSIQWIKTAHMGLRYYEHPTRRHGKRKDRYYSIRAKVGGKDYTYGIGWWSDGVPEEILQNNPGMGFEEYALAQLRIYKTNIKSGTGPKSPKEKRKVATEKELLEREAKEQAEKENMTFGEYFEKVYFPTSKAGRKQSSARKDQEHFDNWIKPVIGDAPLKSVKPFALERIKKNLLDAGKAPRTLQYVFATIRQTWNMARRDGYVASESPTKSIKIPKIDNRRIRFLNHGEAEALLVELQNYDTLSHNVALVSLHCGLRMGEIAALKWGHIDLDRGLMTIMDPKGGKGRFAFMTDTVKKLVGAMKRKDPDDFVFTRKENEQLTGAPKGFFCVLKKMGLNDGISDSRQKVCFHTLRHTFASWHVEAGTDLYTLKELLGHSVLAMTERYSHLGQNALQNAVKNLERSLEIVKEKNVGDVNLVSSSPSAGS